MTVDVVIVNYRSGQVLRACLAAARRFCGPSARFILVDNSPGDGVAEVMKTMIPSAVIVSNSRNVGFAAAVNQGVKAGSGELVLLLNPDVTEIRGSIEIVWEVLHREERVGAVAAQLRNSDGTIQKGCGRQLRLFDVISRELSLPERLPWWRALARARMPEWDYASVREIDTARGAWLCLRRKALEDVGPFDERFFMYWEETDWLIRAKRRDWKTIFVPQIQVIHFGRSSSGAESSGVVPEGADSVIDDLSLLYLESLHKYARKHFGLPASLVLRVVLVAFDSLRWLRSVVKHLPNRRHVQHRLAVQVTGCAPNRLTSRPDERDLPSSEPGSSRSAPQLRESLAPPSKANR
jgi:N-acetylglucosaminyl-diphospho-decaprenol L-rhamnosyltransferase